MLQSSLFTDYPTRMRRIVGMGVAVVMVGILATRIIAIVVPPPLVLESPPEQLHTSSRTVTIRGTTAPGATVYINGRPFTPNAQGAFTADVILIPGANTIGLEARTRHSRSAHIERHIQVIAADAPVAIRN